MAVGLCDDKTVERVQAAGRDHNIDAGTIFAFVKFDRSCVAETKLFPVIDTKRVVIGDSIGNGWLAGDRIRGTDDLGEHDLDAVDTFGKTKLSEVTAAVGVRSESQWRHYRVA